MILLAILAFAQGSPAVCPVMGVEAIATIGKFDYAGIRLGFCCLGCRGAFESDPAEVVKSASEKKAVFGEFQFDPVNHMRIDPKKATGLASEWKGIRYRFQLSNTLDEFSAKPEKFVATPKKEATYCSGEKAKKEGYAKALGYGDHKGVRYYLYCPGCLASFKKDPEAFAEMAKGTVHDLVGHEVPAEKH